MNYQDDDDNDDDKVVKRSIEEAKHANSLSNNGNIEIGHTTV